MRVLRKLSSGDQSCPTHISGVAGATVWKSALFPPLFAVHTDTPVSLLYRVSSSRKPGSLLFIDAVKAAEVAIRHLLYSLLQRTPLGVDRCLQRMGWSRAGDFQQWKLSFWKWKILLKISPELKK